MEQLKRTFWKLPRLKLENFTINQRGANETIAEWMERNRVTDEEYAWVRAQPLCGEPSLKRLRVAFTRAGFLDVWLDLHEDGETLEFRVRLTAQVGVANSAELLRLWIQILRRSGFRVGFCEVGMTDIDGAIVHGHSLTDNIDVLYDNGPPNIER